MVRLKVDKTIKIVHSRFPMERVLKELEKEILLCSIRDKIFDERNLLE